MSCAMAGSKSSDPYEIRSELEAAPRPIGGRRSHIVEFYANRSVFITGASGFIGKVLVEKLLRTCPTIRRIFVLIRPKWDKRPDERLRELLDSPLFDGVREQKLHERVVLVEGDVTQPNLGVSGNNLSRIIKEVSVIFHSAATVKFDEPLKQSVNINIAGTKNMIEICRRIPQLAALVHVSTAYANSNLAEVEEHIYPVEMDPEKLIQMADWLDQDTLQALKGRLLGARPNTYTYTKALAEWLLVRSARDLPVVVCRPSIVVASRQEPFRGWIDNLNGPTGVILGAGKGLIRSMFAEKNFVADLVPVDTVINLAVALAWFAHINKGQKHLNESAESIAESLISGRSTSPSESASTSGDELGFEAESAQANENSTASASNEPRRQHDDDDDKSDQSNKVAIEQESNRQQDLSAEQKNQEQLQEQRINKKQQTQTPDDGYGSLRNSDHNSETSHSDTASNSSSSGSSMTRHRNHHHHHHHHNHHHHHHHHLHHESLKHQHHQHRRRHHHARPSILVQSCNDSATDQRKQQTPDNEKQIDENLQFKLRQFRQRTKAKLNELQLPEEIADVPVFHCTSGSENPITWGRIQVLILAALAIFPCNTTYRYPCGSFTSNQTLDNFYRITLHYIPGYIVDFLTKLFGGKPIIVRIFNKFDQAASVLKAFTSRQWKFNSNNRLFLLEELMTDEDKRLFNFDLRSLEWDQFLHDYVLGVKKFLLKESISSLEQARSNLKMIYYRNLSIQVLFMATFVYYFAAKCTNLLP